MGRFLMQKTFGAFVAAAILFALAGMFVPCSAYAADPDGLALPPSTFCTNTEWKSVDAGKTCTIDFVCEGVDGAIVESSDKSIATGTFADGQLVVAGKAGGSTTLTVVPVASDSYGPSDSVEIQVDVIPAGVSKKLTVDSKNTALRIPFDERFPAGDSVSFNFFTWRTSNSKVISLASPGEKFSTMDILLGGTAHIAGETYVTLNAAGRGYAEVSCWFQGQLYRKIGVYVDKGVVSVPENASLTYSGCEKLGPEGIGYSAWTSQKAVDVGRYESVCTLDGNHVWSDGTTAPKAVSWSIEKATLIAKYAGESTKTKNPELKVDVTGFVGEDSPANVEGYVAPIVKAPSEMECGRSYFLKPSGGQAKNYDFSYEGGTLKVLHDFGDPFFSFSEDGRTATARWVCSFDPLHVLTEECQVTYRMVEEPTCTKRGVTRYTATASAEQFQEVSGGTAEKDIADYPANGHDLRLDVAVPATCEKKGLSAGFHCAVCNEILTPQEETEALGHDLVSYPAVTPACTEIGNGPYEACSRCSYSTYMPYFFDHLFGEYVSDGNATCLNDGTKTAKCSRCSGTNTIRDYGSALGHDMGDCVYDENATCYFDGTETSRCSRCDRSVSRAVSGTVLDHSFTNYIANRDALCEIDGTKTASCDNGCGMLRTVRDEGSALGHQWVANGAYEADDWHGGENYFRCSRCSASRSEATPRKYRVADEPAAEQNLKAYDGSYISVWPKGAGYYFEGKSEAVAAGEYTVTCKLFDNYMWKDGSRAPRTLKWTIQKAKMNALSLSRNGEPMDSFVYTGRTIGFSVSMLYSASTPNVLGERLIYSGGLKSDDFKVTFSNLPKKIGVYKVTVTAVKGNFAGSVSRAFTVTPAVPKHKKQSALKGKKATLTLKKVSKASGYEVKYAQVKRNLDASFKGAKVASSKKPSVTLKKLKKRKWYHIQVRSYAKVGGKKIYSPWSRDKWIKWG